MKNLLSVLTLLLFSVLLSAQISESEFPKGEFMKGCLAQAKALPNVNPDDYCACTYYGLLNNMSKAEIQEFTDFSESQPTQDDAVAFLMGKPKLMGVIMKCMEGGDASTYGATATPKQEAQAVKMESFMDDKEVAKIKKTYVKECLSGLKKDKTAGLIDGPEFCDCTWYKIANSSQGIMLFLSADSPETEKLIEQYALECLEEQD
jgi:hypothetical protein